MMWSIYKKEMLDSLRDRKTILLGVFIPIAMILAMTLFYENVLFGGNENKVYTVAVEERLDAESFEWLNGLGRIEAVRSSDPTQAIRDGEAVAALYAGDGLIRRIQSGDNAEVRIVADQGSMNGSDAVYELRQQLGGLQQMIIDSRLAEAGVDPQTIRPIDVSVEELSGQDSSSLMMASMLLPLLIVMSVMICGQSSAVELFAGEKERKTMEALLMTPVNRGTLVMAKWLTIATLGFISGLFAIFGFVVMVQTMTERLRAALDFNASSLTLLLAAVACIILFAMLIAAIQIIFSLFAKSFKEAQSYFGPVMFIAIVPYFFMTMIGVNELSAVHFLIPLLNTFALLKELLYGVFSISNVFMTIFSTGLLVLVMYVIAAVMFKKDKWVLGK